MNLITKNNYEAYLLDYVEENLSPELVADLMLFLEKNPDLKEVLADFEIHPLVPLEITILDKSILKKEKVTLSNYEELIITEIEEQNDIKTSLALHLFLDQNPDLQKEYVAYQKTKLVAPTIIFENKKAIKKKVGIVIPMYWWYSSAAAVIIILFLLNGFNNNEKAYFPIAGREEVVLPVNETEISILFNKIILEEIQLASIKKNKVNTSKKNKKNAPLNLPLKEEHENSTSLAVLENKKVITDSSLIKEPKLQDEILEENLYANVKIVYEEEEIESDIPVSIPSKKMSKLSMASLLAKDRVNKNLSKGKERILLALNAKPLNLFKRKKKN